MRPHAFALWPRSLNRAPVLALALVLCLVFVGAQAAAAPASSVSEKNEAVDNQPSDAPGYSMGALRELAGKVQRTGVGMDKIPSLFQPKYLSISDADLSLENNDVVFLVEYPDNLVRVYPRRIMVWHEVVNDVLPDKDGLIPPIIPGLPEASGAIFCVTYSPLTGSAVAFKSMAGKYPTSFGVSGHLLYGNSVLYDRISRSLWSQLLAVGIEGPFKGKRLERVPMLTARWKGVRERYGGLNAAFDGRVEVLSRSTGFKRSYGKDPYGTYDSLESYYSNNQLPPGVVDYDVRLPPKTRILGLELGNAFGAVQKAVVRELRVLNFTLGLTPLAALYDEELDAVRVFRRQLPGTEEKLDFAIFENRLIDEQTRSEWSPMGRCLSGKLRERSLEPVLAVDSMWFAWAALYRNSRIFPEPGPRR